MSGAEVRVKTGSRSVNLVEPFLRFIREKGEKSLLALLERIQIVQGDRESLAVKNLAKDSMLRVVFGSDEAASSIRTLSGPPTMQTIAFSHHRSEAWIDWECVTEDLVDNLIRVFAIYGQAGCTAPSRVILLDATADQAMSLSDRVCARWPEILRVVPDPQVSADSIMAEQVARARGWQAKRILQGRGVVGVGTHSLVPPAGALTLSIIPATLDTAISHLPVDIQTIGYAASSKMLAACLHELSARGVKRVVPLARMHDFEHVWDGFAFFSQAFELMTVK
jgi:hypothetical protein